MHSCCFLAIISVIMVSVIIYLALTKKTGMRLGGGERYTINGKSYEASSQTVEALVAAIQRINPTATSNDAMEAAVLTYDTFIGFMKMFVPTVVTLYKPDPPSPDLKERLHEDPEALFIYQHGDTYDPVTRKQSTQLPNRILFMVALMKEAKDIAGGRRVVNIPPNAQPNPYLGNAFATLQSAWRSVARGDLAGARELTPFAASELATDAYFDILKQSLLPHIHRFKTKFSYIGSMEDIPLNDIVFKGECLKTMALGFEKIVPHLASKKPAFTNIDAQISKVVKILEEQGRIRFMDECILPSLTEMVRSKFGSA